MYSVRYITSKAFTICFFLGFSMNLSFCQELFEKNIEGPYHEIANHMQLTVDGGYILCGSIKEDYSTDNSDNVDVYLVKTNAGGDTIWTRRYGGSKWDKGDFVMQTSDEGFLICGEYEGTMYWRELYIIKTDPLGNVLWDRKLGGWNLLNVYSALETQDNSYILCGTAGYALPPPGNNNIYLLKLDKDGNTIWDREIGNALFESGRCIIPAVDSGYIVGAYISDWEVSFRDIYLLRINEYGDTIWTKSYDLNMFLSLGDIQPSGENEYIIAGCKSEYENDDVVLLKAAEDGSLLWWKILDGPADNSAQAVRQTNDNGYILCGRTESYGMGDSDVYLVRTDDEGIVLWEKTFGGTNDDAGISLELTGDGNFIICGNTQSFGSIYSDIYLIKTFDGVNYPVILNDSIDLGQDQPGTVFMDSLGVFNSGIENIGVTVASDNQIITGISPGHFIIGPGETEYIVIEGNFPFDYGAFMFPLSIEANASFQLVFIKGNVVPSGSDEIPYPNRLNIFPNPFSDRTTISYNGKKNTSCKLILYDLNGKKIFEEKQVSSTSFTIDNVQIEPGTYIVEIIGDEIIRAILILYQ